MDPESKPTRRRGDALDDAILDAALEQLKDGGYAGFTIEGIAERAGTSRHVVYRRWKTKEDLVLAMLRRDGARNQTPAPDTGSLREDVIALLMQAGRSRLGMAAVYSVQLGAYFQETGRTLQDLRQEIIGDRPSAMRIILDQAIARGDVDASRITPRIVTLPVDLLRHEALMNLTTVSEATILEIVDEIFLPLVLR